MTRKRLSVLLGITLASLALSGAHPSIAGAAEPAAPATRVPNAVLERPVALRQGIGNSHEAVTTSSPQAQAYFDQGQNYLEGYVWIEAARSFHQALRLDPNLAMACVGLSRAASGLGDPAAARSWLAKAEALAPKASPRERRRIALREKQLEAMGRPKDARRVREYRGAIDDALSLDAEPGLWLLRGNAEERDAAGRGEHGNEASTIYYRHILGMHPDHASAHHFLAHTYEGLGQADSALAHAEAYARLAPAIPNAATLWGRALRRVGRAQEAVAQFQRADRLGRAYHEAENLDPALDRQHADNLVLLREARAGQAVEVAKMR